MARLLNLIFGCRHRRMSRVWTREGRTYTVCLDCGAERPYKGAMVGGKTA